MENINDRLIDNDELFTDEGRAIDAALYNAQFELRRLQDSFKEVARWAAEKLERSVARLEETGETDNGLGTLQAMGSEVDRLAGQINTQASSVRLLLAVREDVDGQQYTGAENAAVADDSRLDYEGPAVADDADPSLGRSENTH